MKALQYSENELRLLYKKEKTTSDGVTLFQEVPVFSRSVDLVEYRFNEETITAIEFKLHDWKNALQQVQDINMAFDYTYICIPKPKTEQTLSQIKDTCLKFKVGLIVYNDLYDRFETSVVCLKNRSIWKMKKNRIIDALEGKLNDPTYKNA